jgi:hypothetical protein
MAAIALLKLCIHCHWSVGRKPGVGGGGGRVGMQIEGSSRGGRGSGRVRVFAGCTGRRFLAGTLGSRGYKAFLFFIDFTVLAWQEAHVARTLLAGLEGSKRKQESRRF